MVASFAATSSLAASIFSVTRSMSASVCANASSAADEPPTPAPSVLRFVFSRHRSRSSATRRACFARSRRQNRSSTRMDSASSASASIARPSGFVERTNACTTSRAAPKSAKSEDGSPPPVFATPASAIDASATVGSDPVSSLNASAPRLVPRTASSSPRASEAAAVLRRRRLPRMIPPPPPPPPPPASAPPASPARSRSDASPSRFAASMSRTSAPPVFAPSGDPEAPRAALQGFAPASSSRPSSPSPTMASSSLESSSSSPMIAPRVSKGFCFVCVSSAARVAGAAETGEIGGSVVGSFFFGGGRLALSGRDGATRVVSFFASAGVDDTVDAALARASSLPPANGSNDVAGAEGGGATVFFSREATSLSLGAAAALVSPFFARLAASSPSPRDAHRASACRNAFVRSGSRPATILSGLASTSAENPTPESIATHAMIFVRYRTFAALSLMLALVFSSSSKRWRAYPVLRCTSDTTSCRNRKGGFFSSVSVSCVARAVAREEADADGKKVRETPTRERVTRSTRRSRTDADVSGTRRFKRAARVSRAPWACAPAARSPEAAPASASSTRRPSRQAAGAPARPGPTACAEISFSMTVDDGKVSERFGRVGACGRQALANRD